MSGYYTECDFIIVHLVKNELKSLENNNLFLLVCYLLNIKYIVFGFEVFEMKFLKSLLLSVGVLMAFNAQALLLSPGSEFTNEIFYPAYNNPNAADVSAIVGSSVDLLYKDNHGGIEEGMANFMAAYDTTYSNTASDPSDALISYTGGDIMSADWLVVKDGNNAPSWYLFDISSWDGLADIQLTGFWPAQGAISHISVFGNGTDIRVPEPATLALFGMGLLGLAFASRKRA